MGILDLFKRRPESPAAPVAEQQPETPVATVKAKRDYKSEPGHYKPCRKIVRVDNVALAAGTSVTDVRIVANAANRKVFKNAQGRLCMTAEDAIYVHGKIWAGKE